MRLLVRAIENRQTFWSGVFLCPKIDWVQQPQREAVHGCGSIARSNEKVFTFFRVTKIDGVVQPPEPRKEESQGLFFSWLKMEKASAARFGGNINMVVLNFNQRC